jgi:quercetin dioxygenase-like cupin family protein
MTFYLELQNSRTSSVILTHAEAGYSGWSWERRRFRLETEASLNVLLANWWMRHFHTAMFQYIALARDKEWKPGPYPGVELMVLHKNETTGGVTVLRKFHAGITVPAHTHPLANEYAYVLTGEWEESGTTYTNGAFFFAPRGQQHGPHVAKTEVVSLTVFDGPLTVA